MISIYTKVKVIYVLEHGISTIIYETHQYDPEYNMHLTHHVSYTSLI
jgi:hypothetical protein